MKSRNPRIDPPMAQVGPAVNRSRPKPRRRYRVPITVDAKVSFAQGLTPRLVSDEAIRVALRRLGVSWKRAKHWITSPDPAYARKKNAVTA